MAELPLSTDEKFLSGQVIFVGHGRVGQHVAATLTGKGIPFVFAEQNREIVEQLRKRSFAAVFGNASDPVVLIQAHIAQVPLPLWHGRHPINRCHDRLLGAETDSPREASTKESPSSSPCRTGEGISRKR